MLTIVMYHYVRDLPNTEYPLIKGLLTSKFEGQLDYIQKHYTIVDIKEVARAARGGTELPPNPCLLTFDDGYKDHYETVFPRLLERGITGSFYPPVCSAAEHTVLDVNKIHFILASGTEPAVIKDAILEEIETYRKETKLPTNEELYTRYGERFDSADVVFIKRTLQVVLPKQVRAKITDKLFRHFVSDDEQSFARKLYMNIPQLQEMARAGMTIGGHGDRHDWLEALPDEEQEREIEAMLRFLEMVYGAPPRDWIMCYPFGSYNETTLRLLRKHNAALGLAAFVGLVEDLSRPLELVRLDTNDLPFDGNAPISEWTLKAQTGLN